MQRRDTVFSFTRTYSSLSEVLTDHKLASLGDAYINFVYSLALSKRKEEPTGVKVKGNALAEAVKKAGLRGYLPSRMNRHALADAAEALIVYARLRSYVTFDESVSFLEKADDLIDGLSQLLITVRNRIKVS